MAADDAQPGAAPFVLGLTGGVGMGKTTVSGFFEEQGVPVFDSDTAVHELYAEGGAAVALVEAAFPGVTTPAGAIDRGALGKQVLGNPAALQALERVVHPLVQVAQRAFVESAAATGTRLVVLSIPLLFETGAESGCDAVATASAPAGVQRARVMARPGMTSEKLEAVLARQLPDAERRRRAQFVIDTGVPLEETRAHVAALVDSLRGRVGQAYWQAVRGDGGGA